MITLEQLKQILPLNKELDQWLPLVNSILLQYDIVSKERIACFLAQTGHESLDFTLLQENLNYGAPGLLATFSKYFDGPAATAYQRQPAKIANRVYANRMGNGDEASGDGWRFRGRGILQITGKTNYLACSQALFGDATLITFPDKLLEKEWALRSACWFWQKNNLNGFATAASFSTLTQRINGGQNGASDRLSRFQRALATL
jgi:putative chitinase